MLRSREGCPPFRSNINNGREILCSESEYKDPHPSDKQHKKTDHMGQSAIRKQRSSNGLIVGLFQYSVGQFMYFLSANENSLHSSNTSFQSRTVTSTGFSRVSHTSHQSLCLAFHRLGFSISEDGESLGSQDLVDS